MNRFLDYESPIMATLGKIVDLFLLNLITLIGCIPIVTIGTSLTACYYAALKMKRGEGYILSNYWKSFKENWWKSTILFILYALLGGIIFLMGKMLSTSEMGMLQAFFKGFYLMIVCAYGAGLVWLFPMQSRFDNSILATIIKSFVISIRYILQTILMVAFWGAWIYCILGISAKLFVVALLFGISVP